MNIWRTYQQNYPGTLSKLPAGPVHKYHPLVHGNSFLSTFIAQLLVGHNCDLTVMKTFALFSIALGLPGKCFLRVFFYGFAILGLIGPLHASTK